MTSSTVTAEDMLFHALYIGSTGAGKTNALLYWILRLFERKDVALVLIDPHGDAAFDLVRMIPESERGRIALIDPESVTFGLNPLSLPDGTQITNRVQVMQTQVEELSALLSDVLNTDASTAPRLMWIFKGALYYLYTISDRPTFKDLYRILVDFISLPKETIEQMLKSRRINDEIIRSTIEAISKLQKDAFAPVINRIANFVLPPQSITSRTFCARTSKLDFAEMTTPGRLTIFRITKSLPYDFRRLISASIVMRFYFEVEKRAARLERAGEPPTARTPIILAIDEFQNISDLKLLDTILSESRKFGLYLWMVNQNIHQIRPELYSAIGGNVGPIFCFRVGAEDATRMAELIAPSSSEKVKKKLIKLPDYACVVRKRLHGDDVASKPLIFDPFPKVREPLYDVKDVIAFMKGEMEERYGGAEEATDLVYKSLKQRVEEAATSDDSSDTSRGRLHAHPLEDTHDGVPQGDLGRLLRRVLAPQVEPLPQLHLEDLGCPAGAQRPREHGLHDAGLRPPGVHNQGEGRVREPAKGHSGPLEHGRYGEIEDHRVHPDTQGPGCLQDTGWPLEDGRREACAGDREAAEGRVLAERVLLRRRLGRLEPGDARHRCHRARPQDGQGQVRERPEDTEPLGVELHDRDRP